MTGPIFIEGVDDVQQLRVQGHTTQTQPLQTWEEGTANDVLAQMTGDGRLQIGDDLGFASPDALIEAHRDDNPSDPSDKPKRAFHALGRVANGLNNITQWIVQELEVIGTDSIGALQTALRVRASNQNTGTPAGGEVRAADIEVINEPDSATTLPQATGLRVGVTNTAGNTITDASGLHVVMNNDGTITNPKGLHVVMPNSGTTTPYSIFTEGAGAVHLEDYVEVKRPATTPGTPATDFIRLYPKSDGNLYAKNWSGVETQLGGGASFGNQNANTVFAGPISGGAAAPAFRLLDAADIPSLDAAKIASGVLNNARISWAAPGAIGSTTPAAVTGSQLQVLPASGWANLYIDAAAGNKRTLWYRSGSSFRWAVYTDNSAEGSGNVGSNFVIERYDNSGNLIDQPFMIIRSNGLSRVTGLINQSNSGDTGIYMDGLPGANRIIYFRKASDATPRWAVYASGEAESGSNSGSNFYINRYSDTGAFLGAAFYIIRATGDTVVQGNLYVSKSEHPQLYITGPSGNLRYTVFMTSGAARWAVGANNMSEPGNGTGSDFVINRYSDAGTFLQTVLQANRGDGNITIGSNLGIGTTPAHKLDVFGNVRVTGLLGINVAPGPWDLRLGTDSAAKPNGGSWTNSSDRRMKRNIELYTNGLQFLRQLPDPVRFEYNGKGETPEGLKGTGFIAQELQPIAPSWVQAVKGKLNPEDEENTELLYVNTSDMIFVLMNSVRELADRVDGLEAVS